jgi:hypothetical protein
MSSAVRFAIVALFLLALAPVLVPACGQDGGRDSARPAPPAAAIGDAVHDPARDTAHDTGHACLDQRERRAEAGKLIPLAAAMRTARARMPGTVVRARLCRGNEGLVYVLTVLARDGKVARLTVDAVKGTLVGGL